ncbi:MAG TPA: RNA-binding protein [Stellaceae bacterium]|nr:RNA-binding protein [Stellaceae bacterium]
MRAKHTRGNVFVANLPPEFSDDELADAFDPHGIVLSAYIARDPGSGRKLRYGFVDIATEKAADRAVAAMNGASLHGYHLDVRRAERPAEKPPRKLGAPPLRRAAARAATPAADIEEFAPPPRKTPGFVVERRPLPRRA